MIIWLASYPRSGNTLFRMILKHSFGLDSYSVYNDPYFVRAGLEKVVGQKRWAGNRSEEFTKFDAADEVCFIKTHRLPEDDWRPAIHIVRDGRDAVVSSAHYLLNVAPGNPNQPPLEVFLKTLEAVILNRHDQGWSLHTLKWAGRKNTVMVRYEDLLEEPLERTEAVFRELGLEYPRLESSPPDFGSLHERWPHFFRRGRTGTWRDEMPDDLHELFWSHHAKGMRAAGYAQSTRADVVLECGYCGCRKPEDQFARCFPTGSSRSLCRACWDRIEQVDVLGLRFDRVLQLVAETTRFFADRPPPHFIEDSSLISMARKWAGRPHRTETRRAFLTARGRSEKEIEGQMAVDADTFNSLMSVLPDDWMPIRVRRSKGELLLMDGEHRAAMAWALGETTVRAVIDED